MNSTSRKRILISIDWFAPGYKAGGPIRSSINFAYAMRDQYDIFVITGDRDFGEITEFPDLEKNVWLNFDEHIQVYYCSPDNINLRFWQKELTYINPDFIYLNNIFSPSFTFLPLLVKSASAKHSKWIIAPRGMLHKGALQFKRFKKKAYIFGLKALGLVKNVYFQATDTQEKKDIQTHISPRTEISIISNLPFSNQSERIARNKEPGSITAIFFSRISPKKNLDYFLKLLDQCEVKINLDIIGPIEDAGYWEYCQEIAGRLGNKLQMEYLGVFPHEEVMERLAKYHLFVLPTHGENFGHAIFEALLSACPVLISDQTPWRGLSKKEVGWDIPLSDRKAYIEAITHMANMDQATWDTWSKASWNFGKQYLEKSRTKEQYRALFQ